MANQISETALPLCNGSTLGFFATELSVMHVVVVSLMWYRVVSEYMAWVRRNLWFVSLCHAAVVRHFGSSSVLSCPVSGECQFRLLDVRHENRASASKPSNHLTVWSLVLEKLTDPQLLMECRASYGTWRFCTLYTGVGPLSLPWTRWIYPIPVKSVLI